MISGKAERARRKEICEACEHKKGVRCEVCGCFILAITALGNCPADKF